MTTELAVAGAATTFGGADEGLTQNGDWEETVRRYLPYLTRLARSYRLGEEADDAVQNTFLRLLEHGDTIRKPEAVPAWLTTVLRRECLRLLAHRRRQCPTESESLGAMMPPDEHAEVDTNLFAQEDASYVREALTTLPPRQRELLVMLAESEGRGYRVVSQRMDMPVGSIGPTRQRALNRMRGALAQAGYEAAA